MSKMFQNLFYKNSVIYLKMIVTKALSERRKVKVLKEQNRDPRIEELKCSIDRKIIIMRNQIT